jgi:hypothetical protein
MGAPFGPYLSLPPSTGRAGDVLAQSEDRHRSREVIVLLRSIEA